MDQRQEPEDDLLKPSLKPGVPQAGPPPWRLSSQYLVAFFGGPFAATGIAWLNAGRLRLDPARRRAILAIGLFVGLAVAVIVGVWAGNAMSASGGPGVASSQSRLPVRIGTRAVGLVLAALFARMQTVADRLYQINTESNPPYASLWMPGLGLVVAGSLIQMALVVLVVALRGGL